MEIRSACDTDIEAIKSLIDRNFDETISQYHSPEIVQKFKSHNSLESLKSQLSWKKIYVATEGEKVVGTGAFANFGTIDMPKYSISNLYVLPNLHGKKIGTKIVEVLLSEAKKANARTFHVPSTKNAIPFYQKHGFEVDTLQTDVEDEITWMTKPLQPPANTGVL